MSTRIRSWLAVGLAILLVGVATPAPLVAADGAATFQGRVLEADGTTPRADVTVVLVDDRREPVLESTTAADGTFRIEGAAPGTYSVIVSTPQGAFLAADSLVLVAGINPRRTLALSTGETGAAQSRAGVRWGQWLIAGVIIVAAVIVANEVTDDEEEPASPF